MSANCPESNHYKTPDKTSGPAGVVACATANSDSAWFPGLLAKPEWSRILRRDDSAWAAVGGFEPGTTSRQRTQMWVQKLVVKGRT